VQHCRSGRDALFLALNSAFDVLVVDRMVPDLDGLTVVKSLRSANITVPVLFLTAIDGVDDRVAGFDAGGDDYLVKPFAFSEFAARVAALGRRPPTQTEQVRLTIADLEMDLIRRTVSRGGRRIDLQPQEFRLLEYLMRHVGEVVTRTMLLENVWSFHFDPQTNIIESHMSRLRSKVDKGFPISLIQTVRGAGYRLDVSQ